MSGSAVEAGDPEVEAAAETGDPEAGDLEAGDPEAGDPEAVALDELSRLDGGCLAPWPCRSASDFEAPLPCPDLQDHPLRFRSTGEPLTSSAKCATNSSSISSTVHAACTGNDTNNQGSKIALLISDNLFTN